MREQGTGRLFVAVTPAQKDIVRARALPRTACPRRYCWWWQSLAFDWDTPVSQGCRLLESPKPPNYQYADILCCRNDFASDIDHYEPREPHLEADGFYRYEFCGPQHRLPDGASGTH